MHRKVAVVALAVSVVWAGLQYMRLRSRPASRFVMRDDTDDRT